MTSSGVNSSVETVNAAAAAIVTADSRVQPAASVQKKRWGSCWSLYSCFGSPKNSKRISHAALVPEPALNRSSPPPPETSTHPTSIMIPFIAPPSSPASFLQSDPPTASQSPGGLLALTSLSVNDYSPSGPTNIFAIGPYANETQLVSPPVFSAFTTEPSTAAVTPPPEPVQLTTPSSPEVPFAELLTSSLNRARKNSGPNQKLALSYYEFHHIISPGSGNSASGTSTPYPDRRSILEFHIADASKLFESKKFAPRRSGSRLGSGTLTPDGLGPASRDSVPMENPISEIPSLANSETGSPTRETFVDHRVSFELTGEDIPTCVEKTELVSSLETVPDSLRQREPGSTRTSIEEASDCQPKRSSVSLGSIKEFNFDSTRKETIDDDSMTSAEWWADGSTREDFRSHKDWTFFPLLQPGVS